MKIDLNKCKKAKAYKFCDGELGIKPFPASMSNVTGKADGTVVIKGEEQVKAFKHCLEWWSEDFTDTDGNAIKLTDEIKQYLFDYSPVSDDGKTIAQFVLEKARVYTEDEEAERGN